MSKQKKKIDDNTIKLAFMTAIISLIEKLVVLIIKLLDIIGGN